MTSLLVVACALSAGYPPAPADSALPTRRTAADTAQALHHVFERRRKLGAWLVGGSATFVAIAGIGTAAESGGPKSGYFNPSPFEATWLIAICTAPYWIPGTITLIRFSKKRERRAVAAYERTHQLPRHLQKRLGGNDFK